MSIGIALLVLPLLALFSVLIPIMQAFLSVLSTIIVQIVLVLILGLLTGLMLDRTKFSNYILTGMVGSVILGLYRGLIYLETLLFHELARTFDSTNSMMGGEYQNLGMSIDPEFSIFEIHIITAFTLLAYNLPILYYGYRNEAIEAKYLVLYLLPLAIYFLVPVAFNSLL